MWNSEMRSTRRRPSLVGFTAVIVGLIGLTVPRPANAQGSASRRPYFMKATCEDEDLTKSEQPILVSYLSSGIDRFEALRFLRKLGVSSNPKLPICLNTHGWGEVGPPPTREWLLPLIGNGNQSISAGRMMIAVASSSDGTYAFYGGYAIVHDRDEGGPTALLSDRAPKIVVRAIFARMHSVLGNQNMEGSSSGTNYRSCTPLRNWFDEKTGRSAPESKNETAIQPAGKLSQREPRVLVPSHEPLVCPEGTLAKSEFQHDCELGNCGLEDGPNSRIAEWCERSDGTWNGHYRARRNSDNPEKSGQDWVLVEGTYKDDEKDGQFTYWKNKVRGWKEREGEYRSGERFGIWRKWWRWHDGGNNSDPSDLDEEDFGTGEPYVRPCTPKPVTWEQVEKATGVSSVQKKGKRWVDCRNTGASWQNEFACIERIAPMSSTWCQFAKSMCQQDEGRWRNPDDCGVKDRELSSLDSNFCPDYVTKNKGIRTAKPALRVNQPVHCAVPVRVPPGARLLVPPPE